MREIFGQQTVIYRRKIARKKHTRRRFVSLAHILIPFNPYIALYTNHQSHSHQVVIRVGNVMGISQ